MASATSNSTHPSFLSNLVSFTSNRLDQFAGSRAVNDESLEMTIPPATIYTVADTIVEFCLEKLRLASFEADLKVPTVSDMLEQTSSLNDRITKTLKGEQTERHYSPNLVWAYDEGDETLSITMLYRVSVIPDKGQVTVKGKAERIILNRAKKVENNSETQLGIVFPYPDSAVRV